MEVIVFLLVMVFAFLNSGSKKKPAQGGKPAQATKAALNARAVPGAKPALKVRAARKPAPAPVAPSTPAAPAAPVAPVVAATQGESHADAEGCVGGSMAHAHHEGEKRAEHARHMAAARLREDEESLAAEAARELHDLNLRRLRQAVVMAEVLDRPKALRDQRRKPC